jgi:Spy/CpxP family protein refolding chaperone
MPPISQSLTPEQMKQLVKEAFDRLKEMPQEERDRLDPDPRKKRESKRFLRPIK